MPIFKYIFKNTLFLIVARLIFKTFLAILTVILARYLGVDKFGVYSTAVAFVGIFLIFNDLGMNTYMIREGSRDRKRLPVLFGNALIVEIVMSIVLYFLIIFIAYLLRYSAFTIHIISLIGIAALIYEARKVFEGMFQVKLKFKIIGWQQIIYSSLLLLLTISIILQKPDLQYVAGVQIFVSFLILSYYLAISIFRILKPKIALDQLYSMLSGSFAFCFSHFFFIIYFQTDTVIISIFRGSYEVGLYASIYRLVVTIFIFSQIILQTCMPVIYQISQKNLEKLKRIYYTLVKYLGSFGLACSVGLYFLAKSIVLFVYGKKYEEAIVILQILAWFVFLKFLSSVFSTYLLSTNKQNRRAALQGVAAFLNLILNLILIPKFGYIAAAGTTLFCELFLVIVYFIFTTYGFKEKLMFFLKPILYSFPSIIILSLFLLFTKDHFNVILESIFGVIVFCLALVVFRFFEEYDKKLIRQIIGQKI